MPASANVAAIARRPERERFYFRVGYNDHVVLDRLLAERKLHADGVVLGARWHQRHEGLRRHADEVMVATCLDTQAMELALPAAVSKGYSDLPWASVRSLTPTDFSSRRVGQFVESIVERVVEGGYTEVLSPSHYLADAGSEWLDIDCALVGELRTQLESVNRDAVRITHPLAVHHSVFYSAAARTELVRALRSLSGIDAISLRIQPFGYSAGPHVMRSFIEACWDLRQVEVPLMVERAGFAGVAAYALGAVDCIESGITLGDSFDLGALQRPPKSAKRSFAPPQRVYIEALGVAVERAIAARLMNSQRGRSNYACRVHTCCPNGSQDMLRDAERHSVLARQRQFTELARVPPSMRAEHFIHSVSTPACDMLARASDVDVRFKKMHRRNISVKETLLDLANEQRRAREHAAATKVLRRPHPDNGVRIIPLNPREPRGR